MNKFILFGAGNNGRKALKKYGKENVAYFCDNDKNKQDTLLDGIRIISLEKLSELEKNEKYTIVITPSDCSTQVKQLEDKGIKNYTIFSNDDYINELRNTENLYTEHNQLLDRYVEEANKEDLLSSVIDFRKLTEELLEKNRKDKLQLFHQGYYGEGHFYGNLQSLLDYAQIGDDIKSEYFPCVSHQDCLPDTRYQFFYRSAVIFSGTYYKNKIHTFFPKVPVFSVGSYIHYAKESYSEDKIQKVKEKYGKTLLVYLPHGLENSERVFGEKKFIDDVLTYYSKNFDTILLCVYWADIVRPICLYAESKGMKVVSNGFRFDSRFNSRQKTLLRLADGVVCGEIGTYLGYAMYMNLPIARVDINSKQSLDKNNIKDSKISIDEAFINYENDFYKFFSKDLKLNDCQKEWINPHQGFSNVRTPEYIRNIFEICKDIWLDCDEKLDNYSRSVERKLREYEKDNIEKYVVLSESIKN